MRASSSGPAMWHHGWTLRRPGRACRGDGLRASARMRRPGHRRQFQPVRRSARRARVPTPECSTTSAFPLAEVAADGSCVITKHPGTGGAVTVATVTEQLLYECTGIAYGGPDVVSLFDTVQLEQDGPGSRVGARCPRRAAGALAQGVDQPHRWVPHQHDRSADRPRHRAQSRAAAAATGGGAAMPPSEVTVTLARTDRADAATAEEASALLHFTVKDADPAKVGPRVLRAGRGERAVQHSRLLRHLPAGRRRSRTGFTRRPGSGATRCRRSSRSTASRLTGASPARPRRRAAARRCRLDRRST